MIVKNTFISRVKMIVLSALCCGTLSIHAQNKSTVNIQTWQTKSGASVYFVESHQLPIVDVQVLFAAGSVFDGKQAGLASLTNSMLDEGTSRYNSDGIAEQFDNVGSQYQAQSGRDFAMLGFRSLSDSKYLRPTVDVFNNVLAHPTFPEDAFARVQKQTLVGLKFQEQQPSTIASKAFFRGVYGSGPYGQPTDGTIDSVQKLKRTDLEDFYKRFYVAGNANVVMVGDLTLENAKLVADQLTVGLQAGRVATPISQSAVIAKAMRKNIKFPSAQTHVLIGQVGIEKGSDAYFPAYVGNYVLGGGMLTSRLAKIIREDHGYVYHVASSFVTMREKGPFMIRLQTRTNKADSAEDLALSTLRDFIAKGPSKKELSFAKKSIIQSFPLSLASNRAILANVSTIAAYGLPLNYLDTYRDKINAVTVKDIQETFRKLIHPESLVTITVGKLNG